MAAERVNTLVGKWNASANLNLSGEQEQQVSLKEVLEEISNELF